MKKFMAFGKLFFCVLLAICSLLFTVPVHVLAGELEDIVLIHHHSEVCMGEITVYRAADYVANTSLSASTCPYCGGVVHHYVFEGRCSCGRTWYETGYACINSMYGDTPSGCPYYEHVSIDTMHMHTSRGYVCGKEGLEVGKISFDISTKEPAAEVILKATYEGELATPQMTWEEEATNADESLKDDNSGKEEGSAKEGTAESEDEDDEEGSRETVGEDAGESGEDSDDDEEKSGEAEGEVLLPKTSSITIHKNGRYNFYASYEEDGQTYRVSRSVEIENIDAAPPVMEIIQTPEEWKDGECTVEIIAEDEGFGLAEKPYSFDGGKTWTDDPVYVLTEDTPLEIVVRDLAGNEIREERNVSKQKPPAPQPSGGSSQEDGTGTDEPVLPGGDAPSDPPLTDESRLTGEQPADLTDEAGDGNDAQGDEAAGVPEDDYNADDLPTAVLGAFDINEPSEDPTANKKTVFDIRSLLERVRSLWADAPVRAKAFTITATTLIGGILIWYALFMIYGTARISWITESGKRRFLARLPIRKEEGCVSLHLRKSAMQSAGSCRICISLPHYYTKLHKYLPLMFSYGGRIYPMHIEERMELNLDDIS